MKVNFFWFIFRSSSRRGSFDILNVSKYFHDALKYWDFRWEISNEIYRNLVEVASVSLADKYFKIIKNRISKIAEQKVPVLGLIWSIRDFMFFGADINFQHVYTAYLQSHNFPFFLHKKISKFRTILQKCTMKHN